MQCFFKMSCKNGRPERFLINISSEGEIQSSKRFYEISFFPTEDKPSFNLSESKHFSKYAFYASDDRISYITDIYPLNGTQDKPNKIVKNILREKIITEMSLAIKQVLKFEKEGNKQALLFVLDIKDSNLKYENIEEISFAEKAIQDFLREEPQKGGGAKQSANALLKSAGISFFLAEGSLKHNLLKKIFSEEDREYFQTDIEGRAKLCQICEIIMNAFKLGYDAKYKDLTFIPANYILDICNELEREASPVEESYLKHLHSKTLCTLYSGIYKDIYSSNSEYFSCIEAAEKKHAFDEETGVTTIMLKY